MEQLAKKTTKQPEPSMPKPLLHTTTKQAAVHVASWLVPRSVAPWLVPPAEPADDQAAVAVTSGLVPCSVAPDA